MIRAALYARVSTQDQNPDHQLRVLREVATRRGWAVTEYVEVISGAARDRPQFDAMMRDVRRRRVDVVAAIDLSRLARSVKRAEKFGAMIDTLTAGIAAKAEDAAKSAQAAGFPPNLQRQAAEQTAAKARTEFIANSDKERWDRIRELTAAADSLGTVDTLFANPVTVLSRAGLGTPERTNFTAQVAGAGPAELRQLAAFAVATKNRVLGAALVSAIDRMPTKSRPFSAADLAEHLCGEETRAVRSAIEAVRTSAQRALVANRNFQNNRANPLDTIKLALRNKKEA